MPVKFPRSLVARCAAALVLASFALAAMPGHSGPTTSDEALLWSYEQSIYAGRAAGSFAFYVDHADPDYAGWPPQFIAPIGRSELIEGAKLQAGRTGEKIELHKDLIRLADKGRVALVFYTTHRTRRSDGTAVDESYENIHVWLRRGKGWQIVGGMSRPVPKDRMKMAVAPPPVPMPAPVPPPPPETR